MATNKRTYPIDYFACYNDDKRVAIVTLDTASTSGERTKEKYDTFQGDGNLSGTISDMVTDGSTVTITSASHGLDTGATTTQEVERISISGTRHYNGNHEVTRVDDNSFTISSSALGATADTISDLDVSSGTATVTTSAAHGYSIGDKVYINASNDTYDEEVTIVSVPGTTSFTYTTSNSDVTDLTGTVGDTGTWASLFVDEGVRLTYHSFYQTPTDITDDLETDLGLTSGLHSTLICYLKARIYEDQGDLDKAMYYRKMYEKNVAQYPSRKSGVRTLAVPYM